MLDRARSRAVAIGLLGSVLGLAPPAQGAEVQIERYSTLAPVPTPAQRDLLAALVTVTFPDEITQVGQAVRDLLLRSGYALAEASAASPARAALLALPLPAPHRSLGPVPLRAALAVLAGPAFELIEDPVHRLVSFERCTAAWSSERAR